MKKSSTFLDIVLAVAGPGPLVLGLRGFVDAAIGVAPADRLVGALHRADAGGVRNLAARTGDRCDEARRRRDAVGNGSV
ncbi:MAG: hypothetical protein IPO18_20545 [bacterium]|nr:hypothetical protein [bacterium]